ncbi:hypothetical protein JOB18_014683 [Solea senegalensis]|uniref:Secreted protein n=1 Tax=Solea senegalensis TaxID=28829 RepID=A0AAV6RKZ1_SOLSE|nr:hypothetical protein JOB18_014683 [Solea senegalensis]
MEVPMLMPPLLLLLGKAPPESRRAVSSHPLIYVSRPNERTPVPREHGVMVTDEMEMKAGRKGWMMKAWESERETGIRDDGMGGWGSGWDSQGMEGRECRQKGSSTELQRAASHTARPSCAHFRSTLRNRHHGEDGRMDECMDVEDRCSRLKTKNSASVVL